MRLFGLRSYRRRGRKPRKKGVAARIFPNILKAMIPSKINEVWISDFTCIHKEKILYLATVMGIVITEVVGYSVLLVLQAFHCHPHPDVYHLDNSKECITIIFITALIHGYLNIPSVKSLPGRTGIRNPSIRSSKWIWEIRSGSKRWENWCIRCTISSGTTTTHSECHNGCSRNTTRN